MGAVSSALAGVASLFSLGCMCGPPPDTSVDAFVVRTDAVVAEDAPSRGDSDTPDTCSTYRLAELPIDSFSVLGRSTPTLFRTVRFQVSFTAPNDCYLPALPIMEVDHDTRTVRVVARAFAREGGMMGCSSTPTAMTRTLAIGDLRAEDTDVGEWTLVDGRVDGTTTHTFTVAPTASDCASGISCCLMDADCADGERCLENSSTPEPTFACAVPCEEDLDCFAGHCGSPLSAGSIGLTCEPDPCESDDDCPEHFVCVTGASAPGYCEAHFETYDPLDESSRCTCNDECDPGLSCAPDPDGGLRCQRLCHLTDSSIECIGDTLCRESSSTCL